MLGLTKRVLLYFDGSGKKYENVTESSYCITKDIGIRMSFVGINLFHPKPNELVVKAYRDSCFGEREFNYPKKTIGQNLNYL